MAPPGSAVLELTNGPIADRPIAAFVILLSVTVAVHAAFQIAFDGEVDALQTAVFGVAFAASLVGLSILRRRFSG